MPYPPEAAGRLSTGTGDRLVTEAMQLLDIPAELRGVHSADLGPLTDVAWR